MRRLARFFRWLGTPVRATRGLFPFTREGRQTLVYLIFAGAGPALTVSVLWTLNALRSAGQWPWFGRIAFWVLGGSLLIIVCGLGMFVSIRAVKLGKDGLEASGGTSDDAGPAAGQAVAGAAKSAADAISDGAKP